MEKTPLLWLMFGWPALVNECRGKAIISRKRFGGNPGHSHEGELWWGQDGLQHKLALTMSRWPPPPLLHDALYCLTTTFMSAGRHLLMARHISQVPFFRHVWVPRSLPRVSGCRVMSVGAEQRGDSFLMNILNKVSCWWSCFLSLTFLGREPELASAH